MDRLLADGAGLPGLSEPGIHTAAVVGCQKEQGEAAGACWWSGGMGTGSKGLTMSTGEDPQLVPILILIQADGTDIILVS